MIFIAALRRDRIVAPCVFDGSINAKRFLAWTKQSLVPTLSPGDVIIMDNLSSHKSNAVRQAIRATGAKLFFLPTYSPDLNPIEQVFSKLKRLLRKAKERKKNTHADRLENSSINSNLKNVQNISKILDMRKSKHNSL